MPPNKTLTTGEVASLCGVRTITVVRWIKQGKLKAYQLPGRGDRRIQAEDLKAFLMRNNMPIPPELGREMRSVLIIEDEEYMASSIQRVLRRYGYRTFIAPDGFRAGTILESIKPGVITLDLNMPGMSGLEVLKYIRNHPQLKNIKILLVSAMPREKLEKGLREGADDILEKPFDNKTLALKVSTLMPIQN